MIAIILIIWFACGLLVAISITANEIKKTQVLTIGGVRDSLFLLLLGPVALIGVAIHLLEKLDFDMDFDKVIYKKKQ